MASWDGADWVSILAHSLDSSPFLLADAALASTFTPRRSNAWQCHILACVVACLAPRIRAEVTDFRICSGRGMLEPDACEPVQAAAQDVCHALRHAEAFLQACQMADPLSFIVSTACTGEALTVHMHNIFWCISGFILATRLAIGFADEKLSAILQHQVHCWSHIISRYTSLGAEVLDHKDLASAAQPDSGICLFMDSQAFSVPKVLSSRLRWLLARDRTREHEADILLEDLHIDSEELQLEAGTLLDGNSEGRQSFARARWAGISVSVMPCRRSDLKEHATMLMRMKNPFILQLIGWTEIADDKGSACFLLMEDMETDLEDLIREKSDMNTGVDNENPSLFQFSVALDMMLQISRCMWYLHRNDIAHGSLQSCKVLVCDRNANGDAGRLKLGPGKVSSHAQPSSLLDFATDIHCFGMLCREMLTGRKVNPNVDGPEDFQLPASTPLLLSDCLKVCCDSKPQNRPEFGVICGLLRHFKLIVSHPHRLERLLYFNEAAKTSSKPPLTDTISLSSKGTDKAAPDKMSLRVQLIDINVHFLQASTPPDIYPYVAIQTWLGNPLVSMNTLVEVSTHFERSLQTIHDQGVFSSINQQKFVIANAGTLTTSLLSDGCRGLLKSGWTATTLGVGTLETWLKYISPAWKDIQKVALGVALCLGHVSKTPPKMGFYSQEGGDIDGFYPIHPNNILLNSQLKVALLLNNSPPAWKGLAQWAGTHPQVGEGADNVLISIEAYTTFYFGHLLSAILKARLSKVDKSTVGSLDQHFEFVLTNLAMRCTQLKYLSMAEVVAILLSNHNILHQNH